MSRAELKNPLAQAELGLITMDYFFKIDRVKQWRERKIKIMGGFIIASIYIFFHKASRKTDNNYP